MPPAVLTLKLVLRPALFVFPKVGPGGGVSTAVWAHEALSLLGLLSLRGATHLSAPSLKLVLVLPLGFRDSYLPYI